MEGCATLVHWDEVMPSGALSYERAKRILAAEVNAVARGALLGGASTVTVNDSHSTMRNLVAGALDPKISLVSGRHKPHYMLEGIAARRYAAAFFLGYHGAIGDAASVMGHTYSPRVIFECRLNGNAVGELTVNAALAGHFGVPVALVSGDQTTLQEAERCIPWAQRVQTKQSLTYYAAECISPDMVCEALLATAGEAMRQRGELQIFKLQPPITLEIDTLQTAHADILEWLPGFKRPAARTIVYVGEDMALAYRALRTVIALGATASS